MEIKRPLMEVIYLYCFQRFRCVHILILNILHLHLFYVQSIFIHIPFKKTKFVNLKAPSKLEIYVSKFRPVFPTDISFNEPAKFRKSI